jgi:hypothetical protein
MLPFFLFLLLLAFFGEGSAEIKVEDAWLRTGVIKLQGRDWKATIRAGSDGMTFSSGENQIHLGFKGPRKEKRMAFASCEFDEDSETVSLILSLEQHYANERVTASFTFQPDGNISIAPGEGLERLQILGDLSYGVLPGLSLDDIIYNPGDYEAPTRIFIPSENLFWILLGNGTGLLTVAWPEGKQLVSLVRTANGFSQLDLSLDEKPVYFSVQAAPGIWHREELKLQYLEKDVEIEWQRPFDAQWKTQLLVNDVLTTWLFDRKSTRIWLPMLGFFRYPVWFDGPSTLLHLSKKIPPKGNCFIYPLDNHPKSPLGFLEGTPIAQMIKERMRRLRIDKEHSDLVPNVGYVHCWGTSLLQRTIYKNGLQAREKTLLTEHIDYCVDYVNRIQRQSLAYYTFISELKDQLIIWTEEESGKADVTAFLNEMQTELDKVEAMYHSRVERGGRKTPQEHMSYAADLGRQLKELIRDPGRESFPKAKFILDSFNSLSAAADEDVPAGFGITIRHMFQQAATACADKPEAVQYAEEIRKRIWRKTKTRNYETTGL